MDILGVPPVVKCVSVLTRTSSQVIAPSAGVRAVEPLTARLVRLPCLMTFVWVIVPFRVPS